MPSASSYFSVMFFISENLLRKSPLNWTKIYANYFYNMTKTETEGDQRGHPGPRGDPQAWALGGPRPLVALASVAPLVLPLHL